MLNLTDIFKFIIYGFNDCSFLKEFCRLRAFIYFHILF
ncbi:hypothetical protein LEP1GSC043_1520 [Leptospira weilii str. Ecochallenge]|uniref:Uncharacterized protein n=1 Tax=Leptospira weilii str. Ecochallenge TaxID=1049986 RepID=N1UH38_9LEPT|nr:hypothetical protein LEP1GSC043_1520 [Leptospira weilii str. Ecochallenge]